ncbi:MAG: SPFH/Band 7/PHB domain protein [Thermoproteota archaeon]|nr:MAG: SPFH/Band 7/PHB domain protein [Candidatus Korarchaeota archaeon]RLG54918.1 MAG: SPFH/Band 7/PHB domain protein [Candidatus Korarchaeota archaeon]
MQLPTVDPITLITLLIVVFFLLWLLSQAIKIVPEYRRIVVFRLGRFFGVKGPGIVFLIPIIDRPIEVDLREGFFSVPHQTCITKDNAPTDIDFLVYYKVIDPKASVINVQDFKAAALGLATTTLRAVVGDITLDETLAQRDRINQILRTKLDEVTERWGVKVTSVEIREIKPPTDVQEAMIKQMAAERTRRAMVTEAEGKKEAAIRVAEGEKQAAILKAEGERQAAILKAEGYAIALKTVFEVAREIDPKTLSLQYLEALKAIAASPATKIVLPLEFTSLIKPIAGLAEKAVAGGKSESK